MGVFQKFSMAGAKIGAKRGERFGPGEYVVEITKAHFQGRQGPPTFVLETKVVESDTDVKPGTGRNWTCYSGSDYAASNMVEMVIACAGHDPADKAMLNPESVVVYGKTYTRKPVSKENPDPCLWDDVLDDMINDGSLNGKQVFIKCVSILKQDKATKKPMADTADNRYNLCSFLPCPE